MGLDSVALFAFYFWRMPPLPGPLAIASSLAATLAGKKQQKTILKDNCSTSEMFLVRNWYKTVTLGLAMAGPSSVCKEKVLPAREISAAMTLVYPPLAGV